MKAKHIIKSIVFMLAIALMTPGVFAQNKNQKINQTDKSKFQKIEKKEIDKSKIQKPNQRPPGDIIGLDENGNPIRRPGGNYSPPSSKSELQKKWAETNCGKQPYGDYYSLNENPCPSGYRKPTVKELEDLKNKYESNIDRTTNDNPGEVIGIWFGESKEAVQQATTSDQKGCIFFPFSGWFGMTSNKVVNKGTNGSYVSSEYETRENKRIYFYYWIEQNQIGSFTLGQAKMTVRCVKY